MGLDATAVVWRTAGAGSCVSAMSRRARCCGVSTVSRRDREVEEVGEHGGRVKQGRSGLAPCLFSLRSVPTLRLRDELYCLSLSSP